MTSFRTEIIPEAASFLIDPEEPALMLGSCFAANIGRKFRQSLVDAAVNPCGTLFNPASVSRCIDIALCGANPLADAGRYPDGQHFSWDLSTQFAAPDAAGLALNTQKAFGQLRSYLLKARTIIVTFGTAWIYELVAAPGRVVANCHKMPPSLFTRRRLSAAETAAMWSRTMNLVRRHNPEARFIFTVSPVRHLKDGFAGNARSKAELLLATEHICADNEGCAYFPAFEIFNDDLRDYRFYADDMTHPAAAGVDYAWRIFRNTFFSDEGRRLLDEGARLALRAAHRTDGSTPAAERFREETERLISDFAKRHPSMRR